jgi:hypothetical protein
LFIFNRNRIFRNLIRGGFDTKLNGIRRYLNNKIKIKERKRIKKIRRDKIKRRG